MGNSANPVVAFHRTREGCHWITQRTAHTREGGRGSSGAPMSGRRSSTAKNRTFLAPLGAGLGAGVGGHVGGAASCDVTGVETAGCTACSARSRARAQAWKWAGGARARARARGRAHAGDASRRGGCLAFDLLVVQDTRALWEFVVLSRVAAGRAAQTSTAGLSRRLLVPGSVASRVPAAGNGGHGRTVATLASAKLTASDDARSPLEHWHAKTRRAMRVWCTHTSQLTHCASAEQAAQHASPGLRKPSDNIMFVQTGCPRTCVCVCVCDTVRGTCACGCASGGSGDNQR